MAFNLSHSRASELLRDPEVAVRLGLTDAEMAGLADRLRNRTTDAADAARALGLALRPRVDQLERIEMYGTARSEYDAAGPVWTYELSEPTRACRALLDALEDLARVPDAPDAAA